MEAAGSPHGQQGIRLRLRAFMQLWQMNECQILCTHVFTHTQNSFRPGCGEPANRDTTGMETAGSPQGQQGIRLWLLAFMLLWLMNGC